MKVYFKFIIDRYFNMHAHYYPQRHTKISNKASIHSIKEAYIELFKDILEKFGFHTSYF
jgi:hypothetical protein